ncbi:MAG: hypothetical protein FIB03_07875 [Anaerolineae bacterium]|nr:hypothetical protein [Anaerolineae bacterium]
MGDGNINLDVGSQTCSDKLTLPGPSYNQEPYPFPPEMPDVPDACGQTPNPPTNDKKTKKSILYPGYYSDFPPTKGAYKDVYTSDIELYPGIYCLGTDFSLTNNQYVHGNNVLVYMKPGNEFSIQGGTVLLSGRDDGDYEGYVMIVDSNFTGQTPNCIVNGAATTSFTGTILAPYCDVEIDGGGKTTSYSAQIIGFTVKVTGSQAVNLVYSQDDSAQNEPKVGLMR